MENGKWISCWHFIPAHVPFNMQARRRRGVMGPDRSVTRQLQRALEEVHRCRARAGASMVHMGISGVLMSDVSSYLPYLPPADRWRRCGAGAGGRTRPYIFFMVCAIFTYSACSPPPSFKRTLSLATFTLHSPSPFLFLSIYSTHPRPLLPHPTRAPLLAPFSHPRTHFLLRPSPPLSLYSLLSLTPPLAFVRAPSRQQTRSVPTRRCGRRGTAAYGPPPPETAPPLLPRPPPAGAGSRRWGCGDKGRAGGRHRGGGGVDGGGGRRSDIRVTGGAGSAGRPSAPVRREQQLLVYKEVPKQEFAGVGRVSQSGTAADSSEEAQRAGGPCGAAVGRTR